MAKKILVVVDAQNDFITGVLGNKECDVATNVIAEEQKKLAEAVRNRDTAAFDEAYNNILNLETSIKKFEHYDDRYLKDAIADAKGKPR